MNLISRIISGGIIFITGISILLFVVFIDGPGFDLTGILIGAPICILGLFILFNKNEDKIEEIKKNR